MVGWTDSSQPPDAARYLRLIAPAPSSDTNDAADTARIRHESELGLPYPFFLAHPLQADPVTLGDPSSWFAEWKWDGIRAQVVKRDGRVWVWSRGEDLITDRFPEVVALGEALPDGSVIQGQGIVLDDGSVVRAVGSVPSTVTPPDIQTGFETSTFCAPNIVRTACIRIRLMPHVASRVSRGRP